MARLILDEGGNLRAFKLNDGRMTLGSGESCTLTLVSDEVADVHAELRVEDGVVTLVPRQGVLPPQLLGQPVKQPTRLAPNAEFHLGGALLRIESEVPATGAPAVQRGAAPAASRGGARGSTVTRQRRTIQKGMPGWMMLSIFAAVVVIGGFGAFKWWGQVNEVVWDPVASFNQAKAAYAEGSIAAAMVELKKIDDAEIDPTLRAKVEAFRKKVRGDNAEAVDAEHNMKGTAQLDSNIKKYQDRYLSGDKATRPAARLFVKRCDEFKKLYPTHGDMGWIDRFRDRYAKIAEISDPSTLEDVAWEVKILTAGKPRDYGRVFALLKEIDDRDSSVAADISDMRAEQENERQAYFVDRLQQSQFHWKKKEYGPATEWLVQVIMKIGDKQKEDKAIDTFLKMADHQGAALASRYLQSYKSLRPTDFKRLMEFPRLKASAEKAGLL